MSPFLGENRQRIEKVFRKVITDFRQKNIASIMADTQIRHRRTRPRGSYAPITLERDLAGNKLRCSPSFSTPRLNDSVFHLSLPSRSLPCQAEGRGTDVSDGVILAHMEALTRSLTKGRSERVRGLPARTSPAPPSEQRIGTSKTFITDGGEWLLLNFPLSLDRPW
jgi:hypothetical protein